MKKIIYLVLALLFILLLAVAAYIYLASQKENEIELNGNVSTTDYLSKQSVAAVTSSHHLATAAGLEILDKGGTAADAAVAVAAALSVVEPWYSSVLGGGSWALYYDARNKAVTSLDGVGVTGSKATVADYAERVGEAGMHQANVPGAWDGWMLWLLEYGVLELGDVLAPAIRLAEGGFPVNENMATQLERQKDTVLARPDTARIYAPLGELLQEGETVYQTDMAKTFRSLLGAYEEKREEGRAAAIAAARDYYRGPVAEAIVQFSDTHNGYLTLADFASTEATIREPISIDYDDEITVFQNPPNSQGITMLLALNTLKDLNISQYDLNSAASVHLQAEAIKLSFADRYYHVGDPARVSVPVAGLLSDNHATSQRERIDMDKAMAWPIQDGYEPIPEDLSNTTTFHVVDAYGNGAAVTTSLGSQFYVVGDTGIHINHRMRFLQIDDTVNQVAAGFKVRHTSNPYLALKNDQLFILGGNTGADTQSQAQAQQFINMVEYGLTPQEAVARPRFLSTAFPSTVYSYQVRNTLQLEEEYYEGLVEELEALGHAVTVGEGTWGNAQILMLNDDLSDVSVGSDPRNAVSAGVKKMYSVPDID